MIALQNFCRILHIQVIRRGIRPGQLRDPIDVRTDDAHFGRHRRHLIEPLDLFQGDKLWFIGQVRRIDFFLQLADIAREDIAFAQLVLDLPHLLAQVILTLAFIHFTVHTRMDLFFQFEHIHFLRREVDVLELEDEIHSRVQSEVDKSQREYYLREQMRQIQNELGEGDIFTRDANDLKKKVEAANLPEEAKMVAMKELERLNQMPPMAPEVGIIRTYIDWIAELPRSNSTPDNLDVRNAAKILERDHY